jgi:hypothetical protein
MAASLYIVVEGEDPGFDIFVNGQALARNEDALEDVAARLKVAPLKIQGRCFLSKERAIRNGPRTCRSRNGSTPAKG